MQRRLVIYVSARDNCGCKGGYRQKGKYRQPWEVHGSVSYIIHKTTLSHEGKEFLIIEIKGILWSGIYRQRNITEMYIGSEIHFLLALVIESIKVIVLKLPSPDLWFPNSGRPGTIPWYSCIVMLEVEIRVLSPSPDALRTMFS